MPGCKSDTNSIRWNSGAKKKHNKKKKDINKRGESKEGGEMDAFLVVDSHEGASISPAPTSVPILAESLPAPVTIVDSKILSTIPLPGETLDNIPQIDVSPSEPISDASSVSPSTETEEKENNAEESNKSSSLKYNYKENQWSPLNPEGKKQYDRDFLLQLQAEPLSLEKPNNLPNLDVIKDKAHVQRPTELSRNAAPQMMPQVNRPYNDFMPTFARSGGPRMPHPAMPRRSQGRGGAKPKIEIKFSSSLSQQIKLHESDNAWKPMYKAEQTLSLPNDVLDIEKLKRNVQGILNKLTPQKFNPLLEQLKGYGIDTDKKLALVIDLIFEKAVDEPNFSVSYANLCKSLAYLKVPLSEQPGHTTNFRKVLLTKCQREFEQDTKEELNRDERMKAIEATTDSVKRKEMQLEFDEEEKKIRYRQLGNIRFIGELFKLGMLIEPIMHDCIQKLLGGSQTDEESLECLCRLLKTIGKELEEAKAKSGNQNMEVYFNQLQKIVDKRLVSSRVRFMIQDIIEQKKRGWVPRRDENNPKTIAEIHEDAQREDRERQMQSITTPNYPKRMPDDRERRKARMGQSEDGWTPSSSKSNKGSYNMVDPSKLKLTKPDEVETIRLGPGGRGPQTWGRGSSGGNKSVADTDKTTVANRYSALADQSVTGNFEGRRGSQRSAASSRESSRGRNSQLPPVVKKTHSTSDKENLIETIKVMTRERDNELMKAQQVKQTADVHLNGKTADTEELALRGPADYDMDVMDRKTKSLIDEFLHNNDQDEAIKCVTELASPTTVYLFISCSINHVLERSSQARGALGQLLSSLLKKKIITFDQYSVGFAEVLSAVEDIVVDVPQLWDYMAEIFEAMIESTESPFERLNEVLEPVRPSKAKGELFAAVLHCAAKRKGTIKLGELWKESKLEWSNILPEDNKDFSIKKFIESHKLEFTICPTQVKPSTQMASEDIKQNLLLLLRKKDCEQIFDWIDANISDLTDPNFIRALVVAVHNVAISVDSNGQYQLDVGELKNRLPLLARCVERNSKLELQALYAIQHLMNELGHPGGLLNQIFEILYDEDILSEDAFREWEASDDPNEVEGKGVAVNTVKSFFTWLFNTDAGEEVEE